MRQNFKYLIVLVLCILLALLVQMLTPEPIDWSMSFSRADTIPFGSLIVFEVLPQMFPAQKITTTRMPIYNILGERSLARTNYVFVNHTFSPDELDTKKLLDFVASGNAVFIAANIFTGKLADTLKLSTNVHFNFDDSVSINFVNPALRAPRDYDYKRQTVSHFFSRFDTARAVVLGRDSEGEINFIRVPFEQGSFYLNTAPLAFTNYYALFRNNREYIAKALSYLPAQETFWDEYYKAGRASAGTPLRYILSQQPLRWAYYAGLAGIFLFILFQGKRRQRIIPIINPKTNTSLEFLETVGRLYFQTRDHKKLGHKKIFFFMEYLRSRFYLKTQGERGELAQRVAEKSGVALEEAQALFAQMQNLEAKEQISEAELLSLNSALERFYQKTDA